MDIFLIVWGIVATYVILGHYLYFWKVVPALKVRPAFWPWNYFKHIHAYVALCDNKGEHHWFLPFLRYHKMITLCILGLMVMLMVFGPFWGMRTPW